MSSENVVNFNSIELKATRDNFNHFIGFIKSFLSNSGISSADEGKVLLASEEIIVNIIDYAYPLGDGTISISIDNAENTIRVTFSDNGKPFNPLAAPETNINLSIDERGIGGYGILMVKKFMDSVQYEYKNGRNCLTIIKQIH
jgi:anti-sigma regulatory factor (Ser/Thr protein kinase)